MDSPSIPDPLPRATYRLQLRGGFDLNAAEAICDYLAQLGISHVYTSPYLQAAPGSAHGYDISDPHRVDPELGGESALRKFRQTLTELGLAELVDVVPNHLSVLGPGSRWWWDVLKNGRASRYADYFDIDWDLPGLDGRVLLPVLGRSYQELLEGGALQVVRAGGSLQVCYQEHRFPISPESASKLTAHPGGTGRGPARRDGVAPNGTARLDTALSALNSSPAELHVLLEQQHYRLAPWRKVSETVGYRRFFDISSLAGLRVELPEVFADREKLLLKWLADGAVGGVRIDHVDGLRDPGAYLERLRAAGPKTWLLAEKILGPGEHLPHAWPVSGTTGYDFSRLAGGLLVDPQGERAMTALYRAFTGESRDFAAIVLESKRLVLAEVLGGELNRLSASLARQGCDGSDFSFPLLRQAVAEVAASMPVYRTYTGEAEGMVAASEAAVVTAATAAARGNRPDLDPRLFALIEKLLLLKRSGPGARDFAMRFQQFTGPVMAKGLEDTAFYRYYRLASLNEVGDDPGAFGVSLDGFHAAMAERQRCQPFALNATTTHDSKRSEDVRARLHLLSEVPQLWGDTVQRWAERNRRHRHRDSPSRNDEYLLYQTLVGAWPITIERLWPALLKSAREAKLETSWKDPQPAYEDGLHRFLTAVMEDSEFERELRELTAALVLPGRVNSLTQTILKLTAPGVPDIYQGSEVWTDSLVDPDNRRPVDYGQLRGRLRELQGAEAGAILERSDEGLPKLWLTQKALGLRAEQPAAFGERGTYEPLRARGPKADHAVAYVRGGSVLAVAPRLVLGLAGNWDGTSISLPKGRWRNHLTGELLEEGPRALDALLREFPVALLGPAA